MNDPVMKAKDASAYLGVCKKTIQKWVKDGSLPCFRVGNGHPRFRKSDLDKMFEKKKGASSALCEKISSDGYF